MRLHITVIFAVLALAGCQFNDTLPTTARVSCTGASSPCPTNYRCQIDTHVCVPNTTTAKVTVASATLTPTKGNLTTSFEAVIQVAGTVGALSVTGTPLDAIASSPAITFACQTCTTRGECHCLFHADPAEPPPDGKYAVVANIADAFGDALQPVAVDTLQLKTNPPQAPDVTVTGLRYHRAPWGELPTPGTPSFRLEQVGQAIAEDGKLVVYAQAGRQSPLGGFVVTAGQTAPITLPGPDQERLYVDFVDNFGNQAEGGPFAVSVVDWVGTLGNKVKGSFTENPNTCFGRPAFEPVLGQRDDGEHELDAASGPTGTGKSILGQPAWRQRRPYTPLTSLTTSAYDPLRDEVVCEACGEVTTDQTWLLGHRDWRRVDGLSGYQPDRICALAAYDALNERVILFGGTDYTFNLADTWSWDGQSWTQVADSSAFPTSVIEPDGGYPGGLRAQLAYSDRRQRVSMLDLNGEAWEWEAPTGKHRGLSPDGGLPADGGLPDSPTYWSSSAFQPLVDGGEQWVLVQLGAYPAPDDPHQAFNPYLGNATWTGVWTGTGYAWSQAHPSGCDDTQPGCSARRLAVDPQNHELVQAAVTGLPDGGGRVQLWRWDGDGAHPWRAGPRLDQLSEITGLFAQPSRGSEPSRLVLVGGYQPGDDPNYVVNETYSCPPASDAGCERLHRAAIDLPPQARAQAPLAFTPDGQGLMMGGLVSPDGPILDDVWLWDGEDWVQGPSAPAPRFASILGWAGTSLWLYGGVGYDDNGGFSSQPDSATALGDVWTYKHGTWIPLSPDAGVRFGCDAVSVPDGGGLYIGGDGEDITLLRQAGGLDVDDLGGSEDTDGNTLVGKLGYDRANARLVLTGSPDQSTFELYAYNLDDQDWDGTDVYMDNFTLRPFYDDSVAQLMEVGAGRLYYNGDLPYTPVVPQGGGQPIERYDQGLAYDPLRQVTVMFGGSDLAGVPLADTWELSLTAERPATTCRFQFTPAMHGAQVQQVRVHAAAYGSTSKGAVPVELQLWRGDHFVSTGACAVDGGTCGALDYVSTSPAEAQALLATGEELGVALLPSAFSPANYVQVQAQALQVEVTYLLP